MTDERYSYEKIYCFSNLYDAYRRAARGKRNVSDIIRFELNLAQNLWQLHEELKSESYRPSGYYRFMIYDPKKREIQASYFRDRVVQHSLCDNILAPYFENRLIYDCAACRKEKGTHFAMRRLSDFMRRFYKQFGANGYFLKCDVRKYFDSVDHDVLKQRLAKFPDDRVRELLYMIIDSHNPDSGKGLPLGNQTSQWFALYYLDPIDRLIKERYRIKYYTRYMDDLVLIHKDKEYLKAVLAGISEYAGKRLHLELNEKTQVFPLSQGVDYLGWHFYLTDSGKVIKKLRSSNKRRFKRRLKAFTKKYADNEMSSEDIRRSLVSYNGHLKHGHTWKLRRHVYSKFVLRRADGSNESEENNEGEN